MIAQIYNAVFYQPIFNLLVWLYGVVPGQDIGIAIILITIILKVILFPFSLQSLKSQRAMNALQPKLKALQAEFKDDKEKQAKAVMELYASEKVSPFSSCLPLLIQLPFLFALYHALQKGLTNGGFDQLYPFVAHPGTIDVMFLGVVDLAARSWPLALLAGLTQLWQTLMLSPKPNPAAKVPGSKDEDTMAAVNRQMTYMMPVMTFIFGLQFPGGLALYWLVMNLLTVAQQWLFFQRDPKKSDVPTLPTPPTPPSSAGLPPSGHAAVGPVV